jgi:hypothetical protein
MLAQHTLLVACCNECGAALGRRIQGIGQQRDRAPSWLLTIPPLERVHPT